jgi:hypothetical protein
LFNIKGASFGWRRITQRLAGARGTPLNLTRIKAPAPERLYRN